MLTQNFFLSFIAVLFYLLTALRIFHDVKSGRIPDVPTTSISVLWILGLIAHALTVAQFFTPEGLDLTLSHTISIVCLLLALALLFSCFSQQLISLGIVILPLAATAVVVSTLDEHRYLFANTTGFGIRVHILGSFIAYSILSLAFAHALALAMQRRRLNRQPVDGMLRVLPPLDAMERFLILLLSIGVVFLSIGIISGLLTFDNLLEQHLAHKTFFSLTAWAIFSGLLYGYYTNKLHGSGVVSLTIWGTASLLTAYFGSKFVLEFLLDR